MLAISDKIHDIFLNSPVISHSAAFSAERVSRGIKHLVILARLTVYNHTIKLV